MICNSRRSCFDLHCPLARYLERAFETRREESAKRRENRRKHRKDDAVKLNRRNRDRGQVGDPDGGGKGLNERGQRVVRGDENLNVGIPLT